MLHKYIGSTGLILIGVFVAVITMQIIPDGNTVLIKSKDTEEYSSLSSVMNAKADTLSGLGITKISPINSSAATGLKVESVLCEGDYTITNEFGPFTAVWTDLTEWIVYADKKLKNQNSLSEAKERFAYTIDVLIYECTQARERKSTWLDPAFTPIDLSDESKEAKSPVDDAFFTRLELDSQREILYRNIIIRLGVDINIGEDKPVQLSVEQDSLTRVYDCPDMGVYPKRPKGEKCITILHKDGQRYPINYVGGGVDIWTINKASEGEYTITRLNGKTVDLGLGNQ